MHYIEQVCWDLALRHCLIEIVLRQEGRQTTGHVIQSVGSKRRQAANDINMHITEHAPQNLTHDKKITGYVPSKTFQPLFIGDESQALETGVL